MIGQTSLTSLGFKVCKSKGSWLYDNTGHAYLDLISGFGVSNMGHGHPAILDAIHQQSTAYLHTNVYGEHAQTPQNALAALLRSTLPSSLGQVYFLSTGSEAVDAAIKLARTYTSRTEVVVLTKAYHGSTLAAESLRSDFPHKSHFLPLLPGVHFMEANHLEGLNKINEKTALVLLEPIQAEAGVVQLDLGFLSKLRARCDDYGALLAFDEIQTGFGRTGKMFAFQSTNVVPDILLLGKAIGGGLPLSALISNQKIIFSFAHSPALGYITTFGGNPLSCAAGFAHLKAMLDEEIIARIPEKSAIIHNCFQSKKISAKRLIGLFAAIELANEEMVKQIIEIAKTNYILIDSFLFRPQAIRIAPPLNIDHIDLKNACERINQWIEDYSQ
ncbi:MAG: aspartate aminotransferase family protein [Saprospiraceae bacterium]|nr:aspartate aminotransferase family protein [Saprospiraceae bacterium]